MRLGSGGLMVAAVLAAGTFFVTVRARALGSAEAAADAEVTALERAVADLEELEALKGQREVVAAAKRPTNDVIAQVNAVLRDSGIPTTRLKALEPEADVPLAGRYRSQTIRLALERLSLQEVGGFLGAWRDAATVWTPRSIELSHVSTQDGGDAGFDVRIVIAATYLSDLSEPAVEPRR